MPDLTAKKKRPLWYNLSPLNLPVPGLVSIFHRISGVALFPYLVAFLYLLELRLASDSRCERGRGGPPHARATSGHLRAPSWGLWRRSGPPRTECAGGGVPCSPTPTAARACTRRGAAL